MSGFVGWPARVWMAPHAARSGGIWPDVPWAGAGPREVHTPGICPAGAPTATCNAKLDRETKNGQAKLRLRLIPTLYKTRAQNVKGISELATKETKEGFETHAHLPATHEAYLACVRQWAEHFNTAPDLITAEQLRQYFIHLKCIKKVARQTSTQVLCAIKLFWEKTLRRVWPVELELVRAQPRFKLPVILSAQEVRLILSCVTALA